MHMIMTEKQKKNTKKENKGNSGGAKKVIIDFHGHIFPERIAEYAVKGMEQSGTVRACISGTRRELRTSMRENGIDYTVLLPVATKPSQFESLNAYAKKYHGKDGMIYFGGIHPKSEKVKEELDIIKSFGFPGIKLHPDYQDTYFDDPAYIDLIAYAAEMEFIITVHAGMDDAYPDDIHCRPEQVLAVLEQLEKIGAKTPKLVLAHMGGYDCWNEVETLLAGRNLYLDTSYTLGLMPKEQFLNIVKKHGADKILFGTDSPWRDQKKEVEAVKKLPLTEIEKEKILGENAKQLLGLS